MWIEPATWAFASVRRVDQKCPPTTPVPRANHRTLALNSYLPMRFFRTMYKPQDTKAT